MNIEVDKIYTAKLGQKGQRGVFRIEKSLREDETGYRWRFESFVNAFLDTGIIVDQDFASPVIAVQHATAWGIDVETSQ